MEREQYLEKKLGLKTAGSAESEVFHSEIHVFLATIPVCLAMIYICRQFICLFVEIK